MPEPVHRHDRAVRIAGRVLAGLLLLGAVATAANAQDAAVLDEGLRIYKDKADCAGCHGWSGRGSPAPDEPEVDGEPGPSLVRSDLDRAAMIELIACGTPGGQMPRYLAAAWTERHPCYGKQAADMARGDMPPAPYSALQSREIDAVVTYVQEVYQGKGMTLANCERYFGRNSTACNRWR